MSLCRCFLSRCVVAVRRFSTEGGIAATRSWTSVARTQPRERPPLASVGSETQYHCPSPSKTCRMEPTSADDTTKPGEEGEIIALLAGDESFEGYWRRPDADAKALREGWYFTGDTGFFDADGDLFVTGRVDDMIITGGENVSPVEIESCLSLHPAVSEVAVVGLADERWEKVVSAFIKRRHPVAPEDLDQFCRTSGLAAFKRPREASAAQAHRRRLRTRTRRCPRQEGPLT